MRSPVRNPGLLAQQVRYGHYSEARRAEGGYSETRCSLTHMLGKPFAGAPVVHCRARLPSCAARRSLPERAMLRLVTD